MSKSPAFAIALFFLMNCGMQLTIPDKPVGDDEIDQLVQEGFITVGSKEITAMQRMVRPIGACRTKRNVCGMDAGISAGFLLNPQEVFYDVKKPPSQLDIIDGRTGYTKVAKEYPIMRPKDFPTEDVGAFPNTVAAFWSRQFKKFKAKALAFDSFEEQILVTKKEIREGRPVLINVRITPKGLPVFMPDDHLGVRTFWNAHWILLVGFSEKGEGEWLIRDNGGLSGTIETPSSSNLLRISQPSLKKLANYEELSDELKLYIGDPNLPIFLDDWNNGDDEEQLQKDFKEIKSYNIIVFEKI